MLDIKRWDGNPVLQPMPDMPWASEQTRNPGVIYDQGKFRMVFTGACRQMDESGENMIVRNLWLGYAESTDGFNFEYNTEPFYKPAENLGEWDHGTVEDTRITRIDGKNYIVYAGRALTLDEERLGDPWSGQTPPAPHPTWTRNYRRCGILTTDDWKSVETLGPVTSEHLSDANVVLFPEKIGGKYCMFHRPTPFMPWVFPLKYAPACMWIGFSDDLLNWGSNELGMPWQVDDDIYMEDYCLIRPEQPWEVVKVGAAGVPIPTDEGWLTFYHAVDRKGVYRTGIMLLDREDPRKVIARDPDPIMEPTFDYEVEGTYPSCIFPCAQLVVEDEIFIYYGAGDVRCCVATIKLKEVLDHVLSHRI
jgi:beta-1,2-mannobiose phosphorylase / 1,2-beta-oligomannan phosphorylase